MCIPRLREKCGCLKCWVIEVENIFGNFPKPPCNVPNTEYTQARSGWFLTDD
jgi:hypothetical protein